VRSVNAASYAAPRQRSISERQYQPPRSSRAAIGSLAARRLGRWQRRYERFEGETLVVVFVLRKMKIKTSHHILPNTRAYLGVWRLIASSH
jgi:hypothetical protein